MEEPGSSDVPTIENKKVSVGIVDWVRRHGVGQYLSQEVEELKNQSVVSVGVDGTLAGLIYVEDQIREDGRHVVESLHKQGVSLYMLSGDKRSTAEYVASKVGISREKVLSHAKAAKFYHEHFQPKHGRFIGIVACASFTSHRQTMNLIKKLQVGPWLSIWPGKTMTTLTHHKKSVRAIALHPKEYYL